MSVWLFAGSCCRNTHLQASKQSSNQLRLALPYGFSISKSSQKRSSIWTSITILYARSSFGCGGSHMSSSAIFRRWSHESLKNSPSLLPVRYFSFSNSPSFYALEFHSPRSSIDLAIYHIRIASFPFHSITYHYITYLLSSTLVSIMN